MVNEIVVDTNFILTCVKQKIQMFEEFEELFGIYELAVGKQVLNELNKLNDEKELKMKDREASAVALKLLKHKKIKTIEFMAPSVDSGIVFYALKKPGIIIATLDRELKNRIKKNNKTAKFLTIKQKKKIVWD